MQAGLQVRLRFLIRLAMTRLAVLAILTLPLQLMAAELPVLNSPSTLSGNPTSAEFAAGVTANFGDTYLNSYDTSTKLDIYGAILVEPIHLGSIGNLYIVVSLDGQFYMRAENGSFVGWNGSIASLESFETAIALTEKESFSIIEGIAFESAGITDAELSFYLAYDVQEQPEELFFSGSPLKFSITSRPSAFQLYTESISGPIIQNSCVACHNANGIARATALVYATGNEPGYIQNNFSVLTNYILNSPGGSDLILSKPQGVSHGGGIQLVGTSNEFAALAEFVAVVSEGPGNGQPDDIFGLVQQLSNEETLRRAALLFAGRLPSDGELQSIKNADENQLRQAVREQMNNAGFTDFLMESANNRLFTETFSINLFDVVNRYYYPDSRQYYFTPNFVGSERRRVAEALAEEPLRLIVNVVSNERPYTEILTADYIMLNPYSARVYGGLGNFANLFNANEWREGEITGYFRCSICIRNNEASYPDFDIPTVYPHAGILNSPAFLQRFPSTSTNRNRARSRWAYYLFLGVDIEGLSLRTTDPAALSDESNPTLNNQNCTVCHNIMDPVAGAFQNYSDSGLYRPQPGGQHALPGSYRRDGTGLYQFGDTWYADMLEPGFNGALAPDPDNSLQWLAQQFVNDSRFGFGTVNFWYPAVIGREPLEKPANPEDADYPIKQAAYLDELTLMNQIASDFVSGNHGNGAHNLKDLLVDLVMSDYFRAASVSSVNAQNLSQLNDVGVGRLLTPEQLNRKLVATTGYYWDYNDANSLVDVYRLTYGGIDSMGITERADELTALMSTVVVAMANETSCDMVSLDFYRSRNLRSLFPEVELSTLPTSNPAAIRRNIQYLHERLLGEELTSNDPEIDATYNLFVETWTARVEANIGPEVSTQAEFCLFEENQDQVTLDSNQTLRSWAVVLNYLLRDYKFIHE